jgi:hypothetical protein
MNSILFLYINFGFAYALLWPMFRDMKNESSHIILRKAGETGAAFIGKLVLNGLIWPIPVAYLTYDFTKRYIVPWLFNPK